MSPVPKTVRHIGDTHWIFVGWAKKMFHLEFPCFSPEVVENKCPKGKAHVTVFSFPWHVTQDASKSWDHTCGVRLLGCLAHGSVFHPFNCTTPTYWVAGDGKLHSGVGFILVHDVLVSKLPRRWLGWGGEFGRFLQGLGSGDGPFRGDCTAKSKEKMEGATLIGSSWSPY